MSICHFGAMALVFVSLSITSVAMAEDTPDTETNENPTEETKKEETKETKEEAPKEETPKEEVKEETPKEEASTDATTEETSDTVAPEPETIENTSFSIRLGPAAFTRTLKIEGETDTFKHEPGVYVGGIFGIDLFLKRFEDIQSSIGISVDGGYAGAKNTQINEDLGREAITEMMFGRAAITLVRAATPSIMFESSIGAQVTSLLVEPNFKYTGHRYISALIRLAVQKGFMNQRVVIGGNFSIMPGLVSNESNGADGNVTAFGLEAGARLGFNALGGNRNIRQSKLGFFLDYTFRQYSSQLPEAVRYGGKGAEGLDRQNGLQLTIQYAL